MADKYIGDITKKTPNLADYLVAVDGADAYQTLVSDVAKKIIEEYQGSNLGGVAQSIQAGFNVVSANNIVGANNRQGWTALTSGQDLNTVVGVGMYFTHSNSAASSLAHTPFDKAFVMKVGQVYSSNFITQEATTMGTSVVKEETKRRYTYNGGSTWSEWELQPTRSEVNAIANQGAKNLLPNIRETTTVSGITITKNDDGTLTLNGTSTAAITFYLPTTGDSFIPFENGSYVIVGGEDIANQGDSTSVYVGCNSGGSSSYAHKTNGSKSPAFSVTQGRMKAWLYIPNGNTLTDFVVKPMIIPSTLLDDSYVPYGMTNAELTKALNQYTFVLKNATSMDFYNNYSASMPNNTYYRDFVANSGTVMSGVNVMLEGMKTTNDYEWQRVTAYFTDLMMIRRKRAGTWEEWKTVVN